jgi:hypothetical protein
MFKKQKMFVVETAVTSFVFLLLYGDVTDERSAYDKFIALLNDFLTVFYMFVCILKFSRPHLATIALIKWLNCLTYITDNSIHSSWYGMILTSAFLMTARK